MPVLVVTLFLVSIRQHLVRLVDLLELVLRSRIVRIEVGVIFLAQFAERRLDLVRAGIAVFALYLVLIYLFCIFILSTGRRTEIKRSARPAPSWFFSCYRRELRCSWHLCRLRRCYRWSRYIRPVPVRDRRRSAE